MANRQYVGARYVPKFADPVEWDNIRQYEALTIVTHLGNSFTSKKPVPAGTDIGNTEYWANTGNYNAQVQEYIGKVNAVEMEVDIINNGAVNVKHFGAVGNASYYNKANMQYYADSEFTVLPHDDTAAVTAAIAYAKSNGFNKVFFPCGDYYLPNATYTVDKDIDFVGEHGTWLVSTGLSAGSFITVNCNTGFGSGFGATEYYLNNIHVKGNYFKCNADIKSVAGIEFKGNATQHRGLFATSAWNFNIGFLISEATESRFDHIYAGLCDNAIYFKETNLYNPIPIMIDNLIIELCVMGIYAPNAGFSALFLSNVSFGACVCLKAKCKVYITNMRAELSMIYCCDANGVPKYPFEIMPGGRGIQIVNAEIITTRGGGGFEIFWSGTATTCTYNLDGIMYVPADIDYIATPVVMLNCVSTDRGDYAISTFVINESKYPVSVTNYSPGRYIGFGMIPGNKTYGKNSKTILGSGVSVNDNTITWTSGNITVPCTGANFVAMRMKPTTKSAVTWEAYSGDSKVDGGYITVAPDNDTYNNTLVAYVYNTCDTIKFGTSGTLTMDADEFFISVF